MYTLVLDGRKVRACSIHVQIIPWLQSMPIVEVVLFIIVPKCYFTTTVAGTDIRCIGCYVITRIMSVIDRSIAQHSKLLYCTLNAAASCTEHNG
jgi:hypothetical protein